MLLEEDTATQPPDIMDVEEISDEKDTQEQTPSTGTVDVLGGEGTQK